MSRQEQVNKLGFRSSLEYAKLHGKGPEIAKFRAKKIWALKVWQFFKKVENPFGHL